MMDTLVTQTVVSRKTITDSSGRVESRGGCTLLEVLQTELLMCSTVEFPSGLDDEVSAGIS